MNFSLSKTFQCEIATMPIVTQVSLEDQMRSHVDLDSHVIDILREWNSQQTHLPYLSDADLALFCLGNNSDSEAAKVNINNYFVMRHHLPEFFATCRDLQSPEIKQVFNTVFIADLPQRTKENHRVILARLIDHDPINYKFENAVKVLNMVLDAGIYESGVDNDYVLVFDINGVTMDHSNCLSNMGLKKFYQYLCKGTPIRWIGAHYVDTGNINNEFQEFVKSNIVNANFVDRQMIHYHPDIDTLLDATGMELSMLPKELGGEAGGAMELQKAQVKKIESLHTFFADMERKTRLKRTDKVPSLVEVFGS